MGNFLGALIFGFVLLIAGASFLTGYMYAEGAGYARCAFDCTTMFNEVCEPNNPRVDLNFTRWLQDVEHSTNQSVP